MAIERSIERLTLRQLLSQASRLTHEITDLTQKRYQASLTDLHELSRPTRKKSHFPTVVALHNGVQHYCESAKELLDLIAFLQDHIKAIRDQANRARAERG